jgi:hypothetical protein
MERLLIDSSMRQLLVLSFAQVAKKRQCGPGNSSRRLLNISRALCTAHASHDDDKLGHDCSAGYKKAISASAPPVEINVHAALHLCQGTNVAVWEWFRHSQSGALVELCHFKC